MVNKREYVKVWDLFVRISHWSLVILVAIAFLSGDEKSLIHMYSGYVILGIVALRFVWGFIGGRYARFANFIYPPNRAIQYIRELIQGTPKYYIGHNPAAGWMVLFLLIMLASVCATGHMVYKFNKQGTTAHNIAITGYARADSDDHRYEESEHYGRESEEDEFWEEVHEGTSSVLFILILLHISGALASSRLHHENLVKAMITGFKEKKT